VKAEPQQAAKHEAATGAGAVMNVSQAGAEIYGGVSCRETNIEAYRCVEGRGDEPGGTVPMLRGQKTRAWYHAAPVAFRPVQRTAMALPATAVRQRSAVPL
jgi:hypothetical protein